MQKTFIDRLTELDDNSIWIFTKQETSFDEAFKAAKLFDEIPDIQNTNVENYFLQNHTRYGVVSNVHRALVISQLYGLITKTPFFTRGGQYKNERTTDVFNELKKFEIGSYEYNTIKTEQLLKLKIHAIIDTAGNNENYNVLPIVFIYQVLKKLKNEHGIISLHKDLLLTYVMTASSYSDIDQVVKFIVSGGTAYSNIQRYGNLSRVLTAVKDNTNLFILTRDSISINPMYDDYFFDNFIKSYDLEDLHENIHSNIDYSQFLFFHQGLGINLIDNLENYVPKEIVNIRELSKPIPSIDGDDERDYIETVDSIKEENINDKISVDAHKVVPLAVLRGSVGRKFKINPILGKIAIKKANYSCECNYGHGTFISNRTGKQFMEGHHLIPVGYQIEIWNKYSVNVDCVENIVSLCPNCHRAIHYGNETTKKKLIEKLFDLRKATYKKIGININLDEIKKMYGGNL
ncbi:MAG: hypothetical protein NUK62_08070 [Tenericutes bacterium]|nr:hypothetical protein [Mycoplasmatota bacterium]